MAEFNLLQDGKIKLVQDDQITTLIEDVFTCRQSEIDTLIVGNIILNGELIGGGGEETTSSIGLDEITVGDLTVTGSETVQSSATLTVDGALQTSGASSSAFGGTAAFNNTATFNNTTTVNGSFATDLNAASVFAGTTEFGNTNTFNGSVTTNSTVTLAQGVTVNNLAEFDQVDINSGTIDNTVIGGDVPNTITGTTITANTGFTGNLSGDVSSTGTSSFNQITTTGVLSAGAAINVTGAGISVVGGNLTVNPGANEYFIIGNLIGNIQGSVVDNEGNVVIDEAGDLLGDITGNVTGNVTGNLIGSVFGPVFGNVTATEGLSTFYNLQVDNNAEIRNNATVWGNVDLRFDDDSTLTSSAYQIGGEDVVSFGQGDPGPFNSNLALGPNTLSVNSTGIETVAVGRDALSNLTGGDDNVAVGWSAGSTLTSGANNIIVGHNAQPSTTTTSNEITLGNSFHTDLRAPGLGFEVQTGALGGTLNDTQLLASFKNTNSNTNRISIVQTRDSAGTTWTTANTRIQAITDSTDQGYIQFNGTGNTYGVSLGTGTGSAPVDRLVIDSAGNTEITTGDLTVTAGTISDNKGDVRKSGSVTINSSPYSIPSTASSTTFRCGSGASVINLDGNDFDKGDVFIIYNHLATDVTLNFSNFNYVRKPDDSGTNYNASSLTLIAYGICTVNCMEEVTGLPRMVISGNV